MGMTGIRSILITVLCLSGCSGFRSFHMGRVDERVSIRPDPIPEDAHYPHAMAVRISPPWESEGEWVLRAPETLGSNRGLLFIDHERPDMVPVTWPRDRLAWVSDPTGSLGFEMELDMGIALLVRIVPGKDDMSIEAALVNSTGDPLSNMGFQFCLLHTEVPEFVDRKAERTFVLMNDEFVPLGSTKPGPTEGENPFFIITNTWDLDPWAPWEPGRSWFTEEGQADAPLIATVSKDGKRIVALAFDNAYKIMTNCELPCIHADPALPDCEDLGIVRIRGKMYFVEGTLQDVLERFHKDFPEWRFPER